MDGAGFKEALARLGYTQSSFAREHRIQLRTVQNWSRLGPPEFMVPILNAMARQGIRPPQSQEWASNEAAAAESARAVDMSLQTLVHRATKAGWPRDVILAGVMTWLADQLISKR